MKWFSIVLIFLLESQFPILSQAQNAGASKVQLIILGTVQDAGSPQIGCNKSCCKNLWLHQDKNRKVVSLGLLDVENQKKYIIDATPDFPTQLQMLNKNFSENKNPFPDGIFLTHAHIGHYTGLMYLGKEAINSSNIPVFAMPRMKNFLLQNGPWSQLFSTNNINILDLENNKPVVLGSNLIVIPFLVPHRDEFSETVGYKIIGPNKKAIFIPDIDKWGKWKTSIIDEIAKVDYAFIDGTFYDAKEINNRDISQIPHPFVIESMELFKNLPSKEKSKIYFIHFNHTNPLLNPNNKEAKLVQKNGFKIAFINQQFFL